MSARRTTAAQLHAPLNGVRALLLDLDGVIVLKGEAVPGSVDAVNELERRSIPFRVVTNTSLVSRATLARYAKRIGNDLPAERFQSALSASAAFTARHHPNGPLYVLASDDALTEFAGQTVVDHAAAARPGTPAAAVVVGDSADVLTPANLNSAFRLVRAGAELIGMHRNPWWLTPDGPTLDSGAYVTGLKYAAGVRARIIGKPSRAFFSLAVEALRREVRQRGERPLGRAEIAMVGDDVRTDVLAAQRAGMRGVFVLTGKHTHNDARQAAAERGGRQPDAVAASLADVVAALD